MEKTIESKELQELRSQFALLHERLKTEEIVSERMLRNVMHDKMRRLSHDNYIIIVLATLAIPYNIWTLSRLHLSVALIAFTTIFLIVAVAYSVWLQRMVRAGELKTGNLVDVRRRLVRQRRYGVRWFLLGVPFLCVWFPWLIAEMLSVTGADPSYRAGLLTGCAVGLVFGLVAGIRYYLKQRRIVNDMIEQLGEWEEAREK